MTLTSAPVSTKKRRPEDLSVTKKRRLREWLTTLVTSSVLPGHLTHSHKGTYTSCQRHRTSAECYSSWRRTRRNGARFRTTSSCPVTLGEGLDLVVKMGDLLTLLGHFCTELWCRRIDSSNRRRQGNLRILSSSSASLSKLTVSPVEAKTVLTLAGSFRRKSSRKNALSVVLVCSPKSCCMHLRSCVGFLSPSCSVIKSCYSLRCSEVAICRMSCSRRTS